VIIGVKIHWIEEFLYQWKDLGMQIFKMGSHDPFGYLKHKLWPKKGPEVKLPIWFLTTKSQKRHDLVMCRWRATYRWKAFDKGYNFVLNLTSIEILNKKLWAFKFVGVLKQNDIWVLALWLGTNNTIRGKVVVSPKSGLWWVLWVHVCPWLICAPKMF